MTQQRASYRTAHIKHFKLNPLTNLDMILTTTHKLVEKLNKHVS